VAPVVPDEVENRVGITGLNGGDGALGLRSQLQNVASPMGCPSFGQFDQHEAGVPIKDFLTNAEVLGLGGGVPTAGVQLVRLLNALGLQ
jgi:hypothetical protein